VPYPAVVGDDAAGIRDALDHLAALGHRRVAHLAGPASFSTGTIRADAFLGRCAELDIEGTLGWATAYSVEEGSRLTAEVLAEGGARPTAIVAGNDLLALGAYHTLREHGLRCPEDVSVVGFNDMPFAGDFQPPMTTVRVPHFDLGAEAARLLLDQLEVGAVGVTPVRVVLPVELVVRGSTARPASGDAVDASLTR
jgi:LacI family transcriptional regulator